METSLFWIVPAASLIALILAWYFFKQMMRESEGTETMQRIASFVRTGAMSYLKQQYKIVGLVFLGLVIFFSIMGLRVQSTKSLGSGGIPHRRFLFGAGRIPCRKTATYASREQPTPPGNRSTGDCASLSVAAPSWDSSS